MPYICLYELFVYAMCLERFSWPWHGAIHHTVFRNIKTHLCQKKIAMFYCKSLWQCQAAKWKKWQRWSWVVFFVFFLWNVDYMSNISKSFCLGITTLYKSDLLASIFQTAAQTCFYSLYLCSCALEREMERRCKRCVRIYVILCVTVCVCHLLTAVSDCNTRGPVLYLNHMCYTSAALVLH